MLSRKSVPRWVTLALLGVIFVVTAMLTVTFVGTGSTTADEDENTMTMTVEDAHITFNVSPAPS